VNDFPDGPPDAGSADSADRQQWLVDDERRFRDVFENASVGMLEIDADWQILNVNRAYSDIVGYPIEQLIGTSCLALTHPDDIAKSEAALREARSSTSGRVTFEKQYLGKSGETIPIRSNLARISRPGEPVRYLKIVEDISAQRKAEQILREEAETLEVLNRIGTSIAGELELEGLVQMVTDAGVEITGAAFGAFFYNVTDDAGESYMLYTLSGASRDQFNFGMPRNTKVFAPTFEGEGVVRSDDITKDPRYGQNPPHHGMPKGHLPVVSYLAVPVIGREGEVIGGLFFGHPKPARFNGRHERLMISVAAQAAVAIDNARLYRAAQIEIDQRIQAEQRLVELNESLEARVTEEIERRTQTEEALRQAQKMETIGQLSGGIAHDFNNLLQVIAGNLDIIRRTLPEGLPRLMRATENAQKGAERAAVLTQRLLAFSRRQQLEPRVIDPNKLVSGMSELLHRTLGETIQIETVLGSGLWRVEVDPNQLENALINLAVNSRDAMPMGGKLTIETANTYLDHAYAEQNSGAAVGQYVVICVSDTGEGMDAETAERAVDPFFTTKEVGRGTGLGLSMVYGFVKQSGGHLKIYTEPRDGTTVKIYMPRHFGEEPLDGAAEEDEMAPDAVDGETILVCEDDEDVRSYSVEALKELGYHVLEAADGQEALRLLAESKGSVDLMFTDVVLPGGMTGAIVAQRAKELQPGLKILFTTGYARNAIVHHGRLDPGVELLSKPFAFSDLAARIRDLLDAK
jgi:PAS domain S-box-containing protein